MIRDKAFNKKIIGIAIPITLQGLLSLANNILDSVMVGSLGEVALSATALSGQIFFILMVLNLGLGGGAAVLSAQFWGKKDHVSIRRLLSMVHKISLGISLIFMFGAVFIPESLLSIYTNDPVIIQKGIPFLRLVAFMYPVFSLMTTTSIVFRTVGQVRLPFIANLISFFVNAFFNYVFIFGKFGAPAMGVTGAAVGTLMARWLEFAIVYGNLIFVDKRIRFKISNYLKWYSELFKKYIEIGVNVLISDALLAVGLSALTMIMGRMGSSMVAANSIASVVGQLSTLMIRGLVSASSITIGNTIGQGKRDQAYEQGVALTMMGLGLGIFGAGLILVLKPIIVNFYNITEETKDIAFTIMNYMSVIIVFQAMGSVLTKGVLRGGGDTKFLLVADVLFLWLLSVPLGAYTGLLLQLAPGIVYLFLRIDVVIKAIWCIGRLKSKKWIRDIT